MEASGCALGNWEHGSAGARPLVRALSCHLLYLRAHAHYPLRRHLHHSLSVTCVAVAGLHPCFNVLEWAVFPFEVALIIFAMVIPLKVLLLSVSARFCVWRHVLGSCVGIHLLLRLLLWEIKD